MKGRPRSPEVRPLRHRLEVVDRFRRFHLYRSHQLMPAVGRGKHEIWKNLDLPDPHRRSLVFADIGGHVVTTFESDLQQSDDAIVLQLLANRANQYRAHVTSTREKYWQGLEKEPRIITRPRRYCIVEPGQAQTRP
jgi:hypothetical protein